MSHGCNHAMVAPAKGDRRHQRKLAFGVGIVFTMQCFGCQGSRASGGNEPTERTSERKSKLATPREKLLDLVNSRRAEPTRKCGHSTINGSLQTLAESAQLSCAAAVQCQGMASRGYFAHETPEHGTPTVRARNCNFTGDVAENLAWGQVEAQAVIDAWLLSPGHCRNMFEARAAYGGIANCTSASGKAFWVLVIGSRD